MTPLHQLSAAQALQRLRDGSLKCEDYAQALLARIKYRDPTIRAWVYLNEDQILTQARHLDTIPPSERRPLHGLPIGIKDVILTRDMPTQYNSPLYETNVPINMDAAPVLTLRASGALIFGKTSTTEFATAKAGNIHQNLTANPHDPRRTPGGSSSGSGAAVADYHVPIALGTQTGGSVVRPASFNGCYGLKVSWGAVSREGLAQWSTTNDTCGFFTRSVEDLDVVADVFRLEDDVEVPSQPFSLEGAKVALCKSPVWQKAGPGTIAAMDKASQILRSHGAAVMDLELPEDFAHVLDWHSAILGGEGQSSFLGQYLQDKDKMHDSIQALVENKSGNTRKQQLEAYDSCARLRPIWDSIASRFDAVITPSVVDEAPLGLERTGDMSFCSTWTVMQCPALNIPGFVGENGMPIGLTLVGPRYSDRRLLWVAKTIGSIFEENGGFRSKVVA
ncbi:amidase signature enzyme [Polychaeton citri CBS 116435]|uniref:Amidase signature enzyme n=1 Tax=Polychaeton citri CBS 116435 TaxID=1314669 RepID=A0A9P4US29_9PEZI|nr:amidase signature enzyme [Polychaeton citri CBS 116435]